MNQCFSYARIIILLLTNILSFTLLADPLDSIVLRDISGNNHHLSEYIGKGKWTVVNIWGPGCPPCREEMPDLVRFHDKHAGTDAIVLGIAIDFPSYGYADRDKVADFAEEYLIDFPLLLSDGNITRLMGLGHLQALPTTYVYNPVGKVAGMQIGAITEKILDEFIASQKRAANTHRQFRE